MWNFSLDENKTVKEEVWILRRCGRWEDWRRWHEIAHTTRVELMNMKSKKNRFCMNVDMKSVEFSWSEEAEIEIESWKGV